MDAAVLGASLRAASISVGKSVAIVAVGWLVCKRRFKGGQQTVRDVTQSLVHLHIYATILVQSMSRLRLRFRTALSPAGEYGNLKCTHRHIGRSRCLSIIHA